MKTITEEQAYDLVCWSADVPDLATLVGCLDRMPKLRKIKIDRLFVETNGPEVFAVLNERGLKVFYDAKYIEIPPKLEELAKVGCSHRPWMLNCMAGSLSNGNPASTTTLEADALRRFVDVCEYAGVVPCAVSVLTTKTFMATVTEFGKNREEQVLLYASILLEMGFTHMVCSPEELRVLRADLKFNPLRLITPGVRPADSAKDDQVNAKTPRTTFEAGSNLLVIGRPITNGDPAVNLENIVADILSVT